MTATAIQPSWDDARAELSKAEQMGHQTVLQCARVGQILAALKGDTPIREFVQHAGQEVPGLSRSTIHNYLTLGQHLPMLEARQPGSQRAALAMIAETKRPVLPPPVTPVVRVEPEPPVEQEALLPGVVALVQLLLDHGIDPYRCGYTIDPPDLLDTLNGDKGAMGALSIKIGELLTEHCLVRGFYEQLEEQFKMSRCTTTYYEWFSECSLEW